MYQVIEFVVLAALVLAIFNWLYKKWNQLSYEEKKNDIEEVEKKYTEVKTIKEKHPDYEKKKQEVESFKK